MFKWNANVSVAELTPVAELVSGRVVQADSVELARSRDEEINNAIRYKLEGTLPMFYHVEVLMLVRPKFIFQSRDRDFQEITLSEYILKKIQKKSTTTANREKILNVVSMTADELSARPPAGPADLFGLIDETAKSIYQSVIKQQKISSPPEPVVAATWNEPEPEIEIPTGQYCSMSR